MAVRSALAASATLVALAFTLSTGERWRDRRRPQDLAWTAALAMFTVASVALWCGSALGWGQVTFRVFYLFGAVLNVPVLALGTLWLRSSPARSRLWTQMVVAGGAFAIGVVAVAPMRQPVPFDRLPQGSEVFGFLPRALAILGSGGGAAVVLVGAVLSIRHVAGRSGRRRLGANLLIAAGTAVLGLGGLANSLVGEMEAFALSLVIGVALLFVGYLVAVNPGTIPIRPAAAALAQGQELHQSGHQDGHQENPDHDGGGRSHDDDPAEVGSGE